MSNYTPGPWVVKGQSIQAIDHSLYFSIASAKSTKLTTEGNLANARLIAAAPDLLYIASWIEKECEEGDGTIPDGLYNAARAAIKKATGGKA